jgi:ADP-heptose:LPS heptosyltransferase/tetratricopeptide (TPR) repeat protein
VRLTKWALGGNRPVRDIARDMVKRADAARDAGQYRDAALLYSESLRLVPNKAGVHIQCGHMFKEAGDLASAGEHYLEASRLTPDDPDLSLQLGHYYRSLGRLEQAATAYERAIALKPGWAVPKAELEHLSDSGWRRRIAAGLTAPDTGGNEAEPPRPDFGLEVDQLGVTLAGGRYIPELQPRPPADLLVPHGEFVEVKRLGRRERSHWGIFPTLRGVEAIRGFCVSATPAVEVQLLLNGQLISRSGVKGGYPLKYERDDPALRKYVFNIWYDFSDFAHGRYELELRVTDAKRRSRSRHEQIVVAPPLSEAEFPDSDGLVTVPPDDQRTLEEQIGARPSMIRPGRRALLKNPPRTVLVQRADQLGDMVVSIPALRRLREILPGARLIGLLSPANAELAATLDIFDDTIVVDFPDDKWERRRIMPLEVQQELRRKLEAYQFDMAIDLSENSSSRPLLLLSGAPFLFGFRSGEVPSLNVEIEGNTHDRMDGHEVVPHTNKLMGLIEWLGAMLRSEPNLAPRGDLGRDRLATFGLAEDERFIVLHDGARLQFSRWPYYRDLAAIILRETDLKLVMLTDDPGARAALPPELADSPRFHLADGRLAFDDFDALLSFCEVFVGNDSGPKHLASLRGAKVVSIHMARNNWNEWGQENGGYIVSRKVPCTGCLVWHDPEECGKDFVCITAIKPEEVYQAVAKLL